MKSLYFIFSDTKICILTMYASGNKHRIYFICDNFILYSYNRSNNQNKQYNEQILYCTPAIVVCYCSLFSVPQINKELCKQHKVGLG